MGRPIELRWRDDRCAAAILREDEYLGTLSIQAWWEKSEGEPTAGWVAAGLFRGSEPEDYEKRCVEVPAKPVDTEDRLAAMLEATQTAIESSAPTVPGPEESAVSIKLSAQEIDDQLGRVITAWVDSLDELWKVAEQRDPDIGYSIYIRLVHALNWAYTVDEALQAAWNRVPVAQQVPASQHADEKIEAAIKDWSNHKVPSWRPSEDPTFRPYFRRKDLGGRPYKDWASVMVAGAFHEEFFGGLSWVSGKMRHDAARLPIELRQMAPGDEPRWKWKLVSSIAAADRDGNQRAMYEEHLQERDVLGLFSWLVDVFVNAKHFLVGLLAETEAHSS